MLGTLAHPRRPILLLLVFGVFLMIVGITALAQAVLVSTTYSQSILEAVVGGDAATVRALVNGKPPPGTRARRRRRRWRRASSSAHDLLSPGGITGPNPPTRRHRVRRPRRGREPADQRGLRQGDRRDADGLLRQPVD